MHFITIENEQGQKISLNFTHKWMVRNAAEHIINAENIQEVKVVLGKDKPEDED